MLSFSVSSLILLILVLLGEERAKTSAFRTFVRFALAWFCLLPLPLGVWGGLRCVISALPGLFSYLSFLSLARITIIYNFEFSLRIVFGF